MQRYFLTNEQVQGDHVVLTGQDAHHIKNVMRFRVGDELIVCAPRLGCKRCKIETLEQGSVIAQPIDTVPSNELPIRVDLAQALIRRERFEYVLQKATELGVSSIIPVDMVYNVVKWDDKKADTKLIRWNTITKEASEQSHRSMSVEVTDVVKLTRIPFAEYDLVLMADETEAGDESLPNVLLPTLQNILIVIGPEGGFHPTERSYLSQVSNVRRVGLGKRILRSETASSYLLSVLSYVYELGGTV